MEKNSKDQNNNTTTKTETTAAGKKKQPGKSAKKRKKGLPQKQRVKLAYALLAVIAVSLFALIIMFPKPKDISDVAVGEELSQEARPQKEVTPSEEAGPAPAEAIEPDYIGPGEKPGVDQEMEGPTAGPAARPTAEESGEAAPDEQISVHPLSTIEAAPSGTGTLFLVIDDVGYSAEQIDNFLKLPIPMTFALLPGLELSEYAQERIADAGEEMILHQPIEPVGDQDPGPGALYVGMEPEEMRSIVNKNLDQLTKVIGVNNHMGSKGTADPQLMQALFSVLKGRHLYFLDSRTTAETVAPHIAERMGLPFSERNVFLDNSREQIEIEKALKEALEISRTQGYAVMIGHVWCEELASTLALWYGEIEGHGYKFSHLSSFFSEEHVHAGNGD